MQSENDQIPNNSSSNDTAPNETSSDVHNAILDQSNFNPVQITNQIIDSITKDDNQEDEDEKKLDENGTSSKNQNNNVTQNMAPISNDETNDTKEKEQEEYHIPDSQMDTNQPEEQNQSNNDTKVDLNDATQKIGEVLITGFDQPRLNSETLKDKNSASEENQTDELYEDDKNENGDKNENNDENENSDKNKNSDKDITEKEKSENDDLEQEIDKIIKSNSATQTKSKNYLLLYVRKCQIDKMMETDYVSANRYKICETIIQNQIYIEEHQISNASRNQSIDRRIENLKKNREKIEKEWDDRFESFKQKTDERQKKMEENHKKEYEEFEQKWGSEDFMSNFNKASPSLLQLRQRQKIQALSKDFTGAKETKELADQLQKQEEIENEKIAILTMKKQYAQMIEKHKNESECARENWERHKKFLQDEKERNLKLIDRTTQQLEIRKSQPMPGQYRSIVTPVVHSRSSLSSKSSTGSISSINQKSRPTTTTTKLARSLNNHSSASSLPEINNNEEDNNNNDAINEDGNSNIDADNNYKNMKTSPRTKKTLVEYRIRPNNTKLNIPAINVSQQLHGTGKATKQSFRPRMTRRYRYYT